MPPVVSEESGDSGGSGDSKHESDENATLLRSETAAAASAVAVEQRRGLITTLYFLGFVGCGLQAGCFGPLLRTLAVQTDSDFSTMGALYTGFSAGQLSAAVLAGYIVDHQPGHPYLAASFALGAVGSMVLPVCDSIFALAGSTAAMGAAMGFLDSGGDAMLLWLHGGRSGPYVQAAHAAFGIGAFSAPLLVSASSTDVDGDGVFETGGASHWQAMSAIIGAGMAVVGLGIACLPSPRHPGHAPREPRATAYDDDKPPGLATSEEGTSSNRGSTPTSGESGWWVIAAAVSVFVFYSGLESGFAGFIASYSIDIANGESTAARMVGAEEGSHVATFFWLGLTIGRIVAVPLSVTLQPTTMLLSDVFLALITLCFVAVLEQNSGTVSGGAEGILRWLSGLSFIFGLSIASIFGSAIVVTQLYTLVDGRVASCFVVGSSIGKAVLPALISWAYGSTEAGAAVISSPKEQQPSSAQALEHARGSGELANRSHGGGGPNSFVLLLLCFCVAELAAACTLILAGRRKLSRQALLSYTGVATSDVE